MNGHDRFLIIGGVDKHLGCPGYERNALAVTSAFDTFSTSVEGCSSALATVASVSQEAGGFFACEISTVTIGSGRAL